MSSLLAVRVNLHGKCVNTKMAPETAYMLRTTQSTQSPVKSIGRDNCALSAPWSFSIGPNNLARTFQRFLGRKL